MKKFLLLLLISVLASNVIAQEQSTYKRNYYVNNPPTSSKVLNVETESSGYYLQESAISLQKSARLQYGALSTALVTCGVVIPIAKKDTHEGSKVRPSMVVGGVGGLITIALEIASINKKLKSGKQLYISATRIEYNF